MRLWTDEPRPTVEERCRPPVLPPDGSLRAAVRLLTAVAEQHPAQARADLEQAVVVVGRGLAAAQRIGVLADRADRADALATDLAPVIAWLSALLAATAPARTAGTLDGSLPVEGSWS